MSDQSFDVYNSGEKKQHFNWKNTQPLQKDFYFQKGTELRFFDYQLELVEAYQFIKINEDGSNEDFH